METRQTNYTVNRAGAFSEFGSVTEGKLKGKIFLKDVLKLNSMEVSLNNLPPLAEVPFYHKHEENEELYVFLHGQGRLQVDGTELDVFEGTSVRIAPDGVRVLRNTSASDDLHFIVVQAKANSLTQWVETDGIILEQPVKWQEPRVIE
ncbi:cupin domain-containing protein [Paenibacillus sacheonensis]|uniref:Cupin domain-containing protein n=1 Tax=Paenibacillus sacheonensis TaxID=742054 RepID=A0A7X5C3H6_9BACL|nr:cupin domain-containing protein [Paenibacillus sacheonensis]MBM7567521.1 mannose-6-phosphate isomerase-like protein (cupin superfamily) [Paenibacillus sacheonensis]NBC71374.1 cupin domain-containing protein [Paenibacillus sacheonensis]